MFWVKGYYDQQVEQYFVMEARDPVGIIHGKITQFHLLNGALMQIEVSLVKQRASIDLCGATKMGTEICKSIPTEAAFLTCFIICHYDKEAGKTDKLLSVIFSRRR